MVIYLPLQGNTLAEYMFLGKTKSQDVKTSMAI
jgi:hypothetical protein